MINNKEIKEALQKNLRGLTITQLVKETKLTRDKIRKGLAYLLGAGEIEEMQVGKAKLYTLII